MNDIEEHIERTIRRCALELHPSGSMKNLADAMGIHPNAFRYWAAKGRIPRTKANWLEMTFPGVVDAASLSPLRRLNPDIEALSLRNFFSVRPDGVLIRRKNRRIVRAKDSNGYIRVNVNGVSIAGHRVVWALHHGRWPVGPLDHINGNPSDNRIENLREATPSQNGANKRLDGRKTNISGHRGVTISGNRFKADIRICGARIHLGRFDTLEEAGAAYREATLKYFGEFSPYYDHNTSNA